LCDKWGALQRKFGFFHLADIANVRKIAFEEWAPNFEDKQAIRDIINAITAHQLDPYKKLEAESWFLGEVMNIQELSSMNLNRDVREKNNSYTMLKVLIENSKKNSILFIDDFEKIVAMMNPIAIEEESEEIFDRSWLYGTKESPEKHTAEKLIDKVVKLNEINGLRIIITLKSREFYEGIAKEFENVDPKLLNVVKEPINLSSFVEQDLEQFYKKNLEYFFGNMNYFDYFNDFSESYFPLNEDVLKYIYKNSNGNPREIIKYLIKIFNDIILSDEELDVLLKKYQ
jgi:hypothetical protein